MSEIAKFRVEQEREALERALRPVCREHTEEVVTRIERLVNACIAAGLRAVISAADRSASDRFPK